MNDLISREWLMKCVEEGWIKFETEKDENKFIHLIRDTAPSAQPELVRCENCAYGVKLPDNIRCELHDYLRFGYDDFCSMGVERVTRR